jgi:hypothetical protein
MSTGEYAKLEAKIDRIIETMVTKDDLAAIIAPINTELAGLDKTIFRGNGSPPLLSRMDRIETQLAAINEHGCAYEQKPEVPTAAASFRDSWWWDILKVVLSAGVVYVLLTLFPQMIVHLAK